METVTGEGLRMTQQGQRRISYFAVIQHTICTAFTNANQLESSRSMLQLPIRLCLPCKSSPFFGHLYVPLQSSTYCVALPRKQHGPFLSEGPSCPGSLRSPRSDAEPAEHGTVRWRSGLDIRKRCVFDMF